MNQLLLLISIYSSYFATESDYTRDVSAVVSRFFIYLFLYFSQKSAFVRRELLFFGPWNNIRTPTQALWITEYLGQNRMLKKQKKTLQSFSIKHSQGI